MSPFLKDLGLVPSPAAETGADMAPSSRTVRWVFVLGIGAGLALCLSYAPGSVAIQPFDAMFYFFTAERAAYGTPPHLSAFSPQNALGVLVPGLAIGAGRLIGADAVLAARTATIGLYSLSVGLVALLGLRLSGRRSGAALAALAYLSLAPLAFAATATGQPKNVLTFFVILTLVFVERQRFGLAGVSAAGAYLSYQPGLILLPGVLLAALASPPAGRSLRRCVAGFAGAVLAYVVYLAATGALAEAFVQTHLFMATSPKAGAPDLGQAYWTWRRIWRDGFGRLNPLPLVGLAGWALVMLRVGAHPRAALASVRQNPVWVLLLVSGAGVGFYALLDYDGVPDTFLGLTFLALFSAIAMLSAIEWTAAGSRAWLRRPLIGAGLAGLAVLLVRTDRTQRRLQVDYTLQEQRVAAAAVGRMLDEGRSVFVLGFPFLLALNHADNWSIYSSSHSVGPQTGYWRYRHPGADFIPTRGDTLPDVILKSRGRPKGWPEWLEANYRRIESGPIDRIGVRVWVRRDLPSVAVTQPR